MAEEMEDIAKLLGAQIVGEVPDVGGGALGAAHLAKFYAARMLQVRQPQPGPDAEGRKDRHLELCLSAVTVQSLADLAHLLGLVDQSTDPVSSAAVLLERFAALALEEIREKLSEADAGTSLEQVAEDVVRTVTRRLMGSAGSGRQAAG
jgi:hypothetical protein